VSDEEIDRSELEAEAQVLPERELMSLLSPESTPVTDDAEDTGKSNEEDGTRGNGSRQSSQNDSSATS
jgi:hypothetical protein